MNKPKTDRCRNCRKQITFASFRDMGFWEPNYDTFDDPIVWRHANGYGACSFSGHKQFAAPGMPEVVVLCGSTKFKDVFERETKRLGLEGVIVLSVSMFGHSGDLQPEEVVIGHPVKDALDELHKRKIDLADRVLVLNVGNYIGESTRSEIDYAVANGKPVDYLEEVM